MHRFIYFFFPYKKCIYNTSLFKIFVLREHFFSTTVLLPVVGSAVHIWWHITKNFSTVFDINWMWFSLSELFFFNHFFGRRIRLQFNCILFLPENCLFFFILNLKKQTKVCLLLVPRWKTVHKNVGRAAADVIARQPFILRPGSALLNGLVMLYIPDEFWGWHSGITVGVTMFLNYVKIYLKIPCSKTHKN